MILITTKAIYPRLFSVLFLLLSLIAISRAHDRRPDIKRWSRQARNISITRDDWGIAHVTGETDADAVFGMIYAQAEDDLNRIETNHLNSLGRLAEAEGESAVWRDLRMKIFIQPDELKKNYQKSPLWLQKLMTAWADGLNFYLTKHLEVKLFRITPCTVSIT